MHKLIYLGLLLPLLAASGYAQDFKSYPLLQDSARERAQYVLGSSSQYWTGRQLNWYYNPLNQPFNLNIDQVINALKVAATRWSGMCNVTFNYLGTTAVLPVLNGPSSSVDGVNVVGWGSLQGSQAAYAALTQTWWVGGGHQPRIQLGRGGVPTVSFAQCGGFGQRQWLLLPLLFGNQQLPGNS